MSGVLGIFLLALAIVVAVVCIALEARDERHLPAEPESEEAERVSAWEGFEKARANNPARLAETRRTPAELHTGKVVL